MLRHRWANVLLVVTILMVGTLLWLGINFPGATKATFYQLQASGLHESSNLLRFLAYWVPHTDTLERQALSASMTIPATRAADDFEEGQRLFHLGDFRAATDLFAKVIEEQGENETRLFWLGNSYMRLSEATNCLAALQKTGDGTGDAHHRGGPHQAWCTLPLRQFHTRKEAALAGAASFEKLLDRYDPDNRLYRWLLNFGYMTIGGYRADTPAKYRLENSFTDFFYGVPAEGAPGTELAFVDRAADLGIATFDTGRGVAVEDFDDDGYLDLVTGGSFDRVRLYRNTGGSGFEDVTEASGLGGGMQPHFITATDFDSDGRVDLFLGSTYQHFRLYRNTGGLHFKDVTKETGLLEGLEGKRTIAFTPAWGDVDNDGDLDLFLALWGLKIPFVSGFFAAPRADSRLYIQENGRFVDRTEAYGLAPHVTDQALIGAAFGDYNNDGFADLFLSSSLKRGSVLLRNDGSRGFALESRFGAGFGCAFLDVDHDGDLEIFHGGIADARTSTEKAVFGMTYGDASTGRSTILRRDARGRFRPLSGFFAGDMPISVMGSSYGDLNNDGCLDFYFGTGNPESWFVLPNLMYLGLAQGADCTLGTANISQLHGFGSIQKGHGIVFFDWDNDGDQDVYSSLGGMWPGDRWPNQFFVNETSLQKTWIKLRLQGRQTNRFGIGCRIRVEALTATGESVVRTYHMDTKTSFGSPPLLAHLGLGNAVALKEVRVYWPGSGTWQVHQAKLNTLNYLVEPE